MMINAMRNMSDVNTKASTRRLTSGDVFSCVAVISRKNSNTTLYNELSWYMQCGVRLAGRWRTDDGVTYTAIGAGEYDNSHSSKR